MFVSYVNLSIIYVHIVRVLYQCSCELKSINIEDLPPTTNLRNDVSTKCFLQRPWVGSTPAGEKIQESLFILNYI